MRIVALADIHGRSSIPAAVIDILSTADLVIIAGDITNFGGYNDACQIISTIKTYNESIVAVPGNCDRLTVNKFLDDTSVSLHERTKYIDTVMLYGIGGCATTPFHTPQEYPDKEIAAMLNRIEYHAKAKWHVLVTHCPPAHTRIDRTFLGLHVGSNAVRSFIETSGPDLVICGHIHEARGSDRLINTVCINPGTFPKHYAIITLNDTIEYELY